MGDSRTRRLLHRVGLRLRLIAASRLTYTALMAAAALYLALWLVIRLTGLVPDFLSPITLLAIPALALAVATIGHRRPSAADAARAVDTRLGTKDLFLTAAMIDNTPGQYQPLVLRNAERTATTTNAKTVIPLRAWERTGHVMVVMLVLLALVAVPFQLDPFDSREQQKRLTDRKEQLKKEKKLAVERADRLKKASLNAENSERIQYRIDELKRAFNTMKPNDPAGNLRKLAEQRQALEAEWRKASQSKLKESLASKSTIQRFGSASSNFQQWKTDLEAGKAGVLTKKISQIQQKAQQLANTTDPLEQQKLRQQIKQALEEIASLASQDLNAGALTQTMNQALSQLDMSSMDELSNQAMDALQQSLSQSQMELDSLAQSMRDLQSMQQALQTLQTAMTLNQLQPLNGQQCSQCQGLAEYATLYNQLMSQCSACQGAGCSMCNGTGLRPGSGLGMGGPGRGRGNIAPEDPSQKTQYQTQRSRSAMTAGKILLKWKTKESAPSGQVVQDYHDRLAEIQQGASEAILQEQIPPGYHDAIKQYFASMNNDAAPSTESGSTDE